jgi:hypothetical protein
METETVCRATGAPFASWAWLEDATQSAEIIAVETINIASLRLRTLTARTVISISGPKGPSSCRRPPQCFMRRGIQLG